MFKKIFALFLFLYSVQGIALTESATTTTTPQTPYIAPKAASAALPALPPPAAPTVEAKAYIVQDFQSGAILAGENIDLKVDPASLTKIMTSYVIEKAIHAGDLKMDELITISETAWRTGGSRTFIDVGKQVSVGDLLKGVIIQSGNDASVALAERLAGSEEAFANIMNQYAKLLGMNNTHFVNSTGMPDPNHYTTARDLATLTRALIRELPEHYKLYSEKYFEFNGIKQHNRNGLLWKDSTVDGVKTGYTDTAGYCLVTSAKRDNMRLISVILHAVSPKVRERETLKLLGYGFRFFETHQILAAGQPLNQSKVWMGKENELKLGSLEDLFITLPRGQVKQKIMPQIEIEQPLIKAPVTKGQSFGKIIVTFDNKLLTERSLVALQDIQAGSLWRRLTDRIILFFKNLLGAVW